MTKERAIQLLEVEKEYTLKQTGFHQQSINQEVAQAIDMARNALGTIDQIMWERDIAIEQLESYGVHLGEKADIVSVVRCKDCKYCNEYERTNGYYCGFHSTDDYDFIIFLDDFCSDGKRSKL